MKKVLILLLTMSAYCYTYAQIENKPSWWKTGELRSDSTAKRNETALEKPTILSDSVLQVFLKESLFILRQDYSLYDKRKKKFYGFNDQEKFGTTYSLGIKCKQFNVILDKAVRPWEYDENYLQFKSNKLSPVITASKYLLINDSISSLYNNLDSVVLPVQTIKENALYASKPFTRSQEGLDVNTTDTCSLGFLVWLIKVGGDFDNGDIEINLKIIKKNVDMAGSVTLTPPDQSSEILGCLYVTSDEDNPIKFVLSGIALKPDNAWTLHFPFKDFLFVKKRTPITKTPNGRLTEIKNLPQK